MKNLILTFFVLIGVSWGQGLDFAKYGLNTNRGVYTQYWEYDSSSKAKEYPVKFLMDEKLQTCHVFSLRQKEKWFYIVTPRTGVLREGLNKDKKRGQPYEVTLGPKEISIANGYQKSKELFYENSRIKTLKYFLIGGIGSPVESLVNGHYYRLTGANLLYQTNFTLEDRMGAQSLEPGIIRHLQSDDGFSPLIHLFIVEDIYPGTKYPDDICISEINFRTLDGVWFREWGIPLAVTNTNR